MSPFCVSFGLAHVFITLGGPTDYRNYVHGARVITSSHIETQQFWAPLEMNFMKFKKKSGITFPSSCSPIVWKMSRTIVAMVLTRKCRSTRRKTCPSALYHHKPHIDRPLKPEINTNQKRTIPGHQIAVAIELQTVAPNIDG